MANEAVEKLLIEKLRACKDKKDWFIITQINKTPAKIRIGFALPMNSEVPHKCLLLPPVESRTDTNSDGTGRTESTSNGSGNSVSRLVECWVTDDKTKPGKISNPHCEFKAEEQALWVSDLESVHGTFVNGIRIHANATVRLVDGDVIGVGGQAVVEEGICLLKVKVFENTPDLEEHPIDNCEKLARNDWNKVDSVGQELGNMGMGDKDGSEKKQIPSTLERVAYDCGRCSRKFCSKRGLMIHKMGGACSARPDYDRPPQPQGAWRRYIRYDHKLMTYDCTTCGKKYMGKGHLMEHIQREHERRMVLNCPRYGRTYRSKADLRKHICPDHKGITHVCEICRNKYMNNHSLLQHIRREHDRRTFNCPKCGLLLQSLIAMRRHSFFKHNRRSYVCRKCGKGYMDEGSLRRHISRDH